jgi:hypothetical protein
MVKPVFAMRLPRTTIRSPPTSETPGKASKPFASAENLMLMDDYT